MLTSRVATVYEQAALIGQRAEYLSFDASSTLPHLAHMEPLALAERELHAGVLPMLVRRELPNGTVEEIHASKLQLQCDGSLTPLHAPRLVLSPAYQYGAPPILHLPSL